MLRPSALRAFGPHAETERPARDPAGPRDRVRATDALFADLHDAFAARANSAPAAGAAARLSRQRSRLDGVEFILETAGSRLRFVNALAGLIHVLEDRDGDWRPLEVLAVQHAGEVDRHGSKLFQPVRKPAALGRGFEFTTVRRLVASFLDGTADRAAGLRR